MGLALSAFRIGLGAVFAGHGLQKLGQLGGPGLDATADGFKKMGFEPPKPYATAAAVTEVAGGGLLALGYHTPLAASMVTGTMTVAISKVHAKNGLWITKGGMEYNLALIGAAFALTETGPGLLSVDGLLGKRRRGPVWAVAELAVGVAAGLGVAALAGRNQAPAPLDAAADTVARAAGAVADTASAVADTASSLSGSGTAGGQGADVADKVGRAADSAAAATKDAADTAAGKVGTAAAKVSAAADKAGAAADKAAGKVGDAADAAAGAAADKAEKVEKAGAADGATHSD